MPSTEYNYQYTFYSYPNIILPLMGGIFVDVLGVRLAIIVFSIVITLGQTIYTIGGYERTYWIMLAGRVVYGLGGENLGVA
jgi:MFS family permease